MSAFAARIEDFGERLNPVLVREVRQALRGRFFLVTFGLTLLFGTLASIGILLIGALGDTPGRDLFQACLAFLNLTAVLFVPIGAFQSLGSEHDDETRDLLVLSNLSPGQIIRGKFFTFFLLAALFTVALGPFLALSTLLHGVDLLQILVGLAEILMFCAMYTMVALCLSAMAVSRGLRLLLMLLMVLFFMSVGVGRASMAVLGGFGGPSSPFGQLAMTVMLAGFVGSFAYTLACTRFAHPEENRSTPLRIYISVAVFLINAGTLLFPDLASGVFLPAGPASWSLDPSVIATSLGVFSFSALFFASEPSALSARVRVLVPKSSARSFLAYPFLPGGGKAVVWYALNSAVYLAFVWALSASGAIRGMHQLQVGLFVVLVTVGCFLLPSAVLRPLTRRPMGRAFLIFAPLLFLVGSSFVAAIYGATAASGFGSQLWRVASPPSVIENISRNGVSGLNMDITIYGVLAVTSLLANVPRMLSEFNAVLLASKARQALGQEAADSAS